MQRISFPNLSVALLAGGNNSRMNKNKALLAYDGKAFIERLIAEFSGYDELLLSVKNESQSDAYRSCLQLNDAAANVRIIFDEHEDKGPLEGIRRALVESKNDFVFICAADMPFASSAIPEYLCEYFCSDYDCYVPTIDGMPEPLCAVYKKSVLAAIETQLQNNKLKISLLFDCVPVKYIPVEKSSLSKTMFQNVNTPEEYAGLQKPFVFCVSGIKNSGKTRMILLLISELKKRGLTCAVIKHDGHDCFSDAPETDTFRFSAQGACAAAIFSADRFMFSAHEPLTAEDLIAKIKALSVSVDFIIIEGLKDSPYPKVEVLRHGVSETSVCRKESLICRTGDVCFSDDDGVPQYGANDAGGILDCIENYFKV